MEELSIKYQLHEAGWATVEFSNATAVVSRPVSYLHDSLLDLADMAIKLKDGEKSCRAVFMDEPGEYQLVLSVEKDGIIYQVRQYEDWESWGMWAADDFKLLLKGVTSAENIISEVSNILWHIHQNIGPHKYKELWVEHEFPLSAFKKLAGA